MPPAPPPAPPSAEDAGIEDAGSDAPVVVDPLQGKDGISGTFDEKTHTFATELGAIKQGTTILLHAVSSADLPQDEWRVRIKPELGTQACTGALTTTDPSISFLSLPAATSSIASECSIVVTSIEPKFEGTFTGKLVTDSGEFAITAGAFRVPKP